MENFKLRMWNPAGKKYLYDIDNVFECLKQQHKFDGTMPDRGFVNEWDHRSEGMKCEICTSITDKNKKEIYKSDLVSNGEFIYEVEWNTQNSKFCLKPVNKVDGEFNLYEYCMYDELGHGYYNRKDLEIIGNTNENPELIK